MNESNAELISIFYSAFQRLDVETMVACYSDDVIFSDPAFGTLRGRQVGDMWRMLASRAKDFSLTFDQIHAEDHSGAAHWVATYLFSQTRRTVVNDIHARFVFRDARICEHYDRFDLWRWSRQALGTPGLLLGWTPLLRGKIRRQALANLAAFQSRSA
ncbi:nuclear transport factor 2 family protein [Pseudomonas sp. HR96]|uniref:nuclear transport factor 2 family protein n=1 Tax=Pseudomonas sp. HR96 TaxID=1027966 RepID=UPI002A762EAB|nr:nuclear transport factor 2 family protein [Pseudomonas sp. HR96]WPP00763.1 nuclear transport factor 2 family protein [Pseudomonas sp. HR96]